jgi:putative dimethyl sulfoxide reductase chaperone
LEFLSHLSAREAEAWGTEDRDGVRVALGWQQRFLTDHLGKWAPKFCRKVEATAESAFYTEFAKLLHSFLAAEKAGMYFLGYRTISALNSNS